MEAATWQPHTQAHSGRFAQGGPEGSAPRREKRTEQGKTVLVKSEENQ